MQTALRIWAAAAALATCTAAQAQQRKIGQTPEAGVEATATVGSPVLERSNIVAVQSPQLANDVEVSLGIQGKKVIPRGAVFRVDRAAPLKACTVAQDTYEDAFVGPRGAACVQDKDGDGRVERVSAESVLFTSKTLKEPVAFTMVDVPAADDRDYFRQTLTFLGAAAGTLRLSYTETSHDVARPAFTQELRFPLAATYPQDIRWRDENHVARPNWRGPALPGRGSKVTPGATRAAGALGVDGVSGGLWRWHASAPAGSGARNGQRRNASERTRGAARASSCASKPALTPTERTRRPSLRCRATSWWPPPSTQRGSSAHG